MCVAVRFSGMSIMLYKVVLTFESVDEGVTKKVKATKRTFM